MSIEENKALVRRFVEEVQCRHNLAAIDELVSPDFVDHDAPEGSGRAGSREFFSMMFVAFPDMRFTIRQQIAEGDKVLTYKTFHGTHLGPFRGIAPTGRPVSIDVMDIVTVAGGEITEHWSVGDYLSMMQQLGIA
jgi:predicted ester cyclase